MRRLIIGMMLAVCLVGFGEKPKFSISDNSSYYDNPLFLEVKAGAPDSVVFRFEGTPETVYGLKTSDLDILGGYVGYSRSTRIETINLTIKGKASFDKLIARLNKTNFLKDLNSYPVGMEQGFSFYYMTKELNKNLVDIDPKKMKTLTISYDPFSDTSLFIYSKFLSN